MKKTVDLVYDALSEKVELRDDDDALIFEVWNQLTPMNIWDMPLGDFLLITRKKWKLPSEQSIRRARRKCQELYPHTRGKKYLKRMGMQDKIKNELRIVGSEATNPGWG
tara:strand:+ start:966 stop:1292 length:327 start_codon:yes stop_codon:yes gene_type:complete